MSDNEYIAKEIMSSWISTPKIASALYCVPEEYLVVLRRQIQVALNNNQEALTKLTQERDEWKREAFAAAQLLHLFRERHTFTFRETEQGKEYARAVSRELGE